MFKNVASQKIAVFAFDTTTSAPKTGDAANITAYISKDWGTVTALGDTSATEMDATNAKGWYLFDLTQAETNADALLVSGKSATANVSVVGSLIFTTPPNFSTMVLDSTGNAKIQSPIKKNQARAAFPFMMYDATTHAAKPSVTGITVTRSLDGAAQLGGSLGTVSELGNGVYLVDFAAGDTNAGTVVFKASASGCDTTIERIFPEA